MGTVGCFFFVILHQNLLPKLIAKTNNLPTPANSKVAIGYLKGTGIRRVRNFAQKLPGTSTAELLVRLINKFPTISEHHPQYYSLSDKELACIIEWKLTNLLLSFKSPYWATNPLIHEDDTHSLFQVDDVIKLLLDRIRGVDVLRDLYLFLLENGELTGVMMVSKSFYEQITPTQQ